MAKTNPEIRWMTPRDTKAVAQIEQLCFEAYLYEDDFIKLLSQKSVYGIVFEAEGKILGFAIYKSEDRAIDLLNIAVHPEYQKRGIGHRILAEVKSRLSPNKRQAVNLVVRESNLPAQLFFKDCGFLATNIEKSPFAKSNEDGYRMVYKLEAPVPV